MKPSYSNDRSRSGIFQFWKTYTFYGLRLMFLLCVIGFVVQLAMYGIMALPMAGETLFPAVDKAFFRVPGAILAILLVIPLFGYLASKVDLGFYDPDEQEKERSTRRDARPSWE